MLRAFQGQKDENGDTTALYPRQVRPAGLPQPAARKPKQSVGLFDLLKSDAEGDQPKSGAGSAFAAFTAVQKSAPNGDRPATASDFLSHWQNFTVAKKAEQESMTRRMDAVLKNVNMSGFKQASRATTWKTKSIWFFMIFLMLAILIFEICQCVKAYQNSPVATTYTIDSPDAIDFPQVYLCYSWAFNRSYLMMHKDEMAIATAYSRAAVNKGGYSRRKRDLNQMFNQGGDELNDLNDDEIARILSHPDIRIKYRESDHEGEDQRENGVQGDEDGSYELDDDAGDLGVERVKRAAEGNFSSNATQLAAEQKAKAAAAAAKEAKRIEALMSVSNISDVVYQFYQDAAYNIEETFLECEFRSHTRQKLNCTDVIKPIIDANYRGCFLVDLPDDMKQTVAGEGKKNDP